MIEMRWIDRKKKYPDPQVDPEDHYWETVLQYRFVNAHALITNAHGHVTGYEPSWSEWQDVQRHNAAKRSET